ncbi:hypothetical protein B0O99DRAFT_728451 [Bisporella sp. PMI_857]|nr:hypothetical protein B0O99DRAFT_728451 [Bisporella sp. PMI_857]
MITRTLSTFLQYPLEGIQTGDFQAYINYFEETWDAAKRGDERETLQPVSHKDIQTITQIIADQFFNGRLCQRALLREELHEIMQFRDRSEENLNGVISLTLRLWLAMNFRDEGITSATQSIHWGDTSPLDAFVAQQFPTPRLHIEAGERMFDFVLPDNFTVVKLRHYAGIDIDWTTSLNEHLDWDHKNRVLKIFPLKSYMHGLRERSNRLQP